MTEQEEIKSLKEMLSKITSLTYDYHWCSPLSCTICGAVAGIGKHSPDCIVHKAEIMSGTK